MKTKYFPCPICKGKGGYTEPVTDDGRGPYYPCGYCDDKAMIEIGGERHREIVATSIAIKILDFVKPEKDEWSVAELIDLGNKALDLFKEPSSA